MIVADSSVWIDYLRQRPSSAAAFLDGLVGRASVLVGDLILHELLAGVRSEVEADRPRHSFEPLPFVFMGGQQVAVEAGRICRALCARGVTIRKTVDLFIGSYCILHQHILLQSDRDVLPMQEFGRHLWPA